MAELETAVLDVPDNSVVETEAPLLEDTAEVETTDEDTGEETADTESDFAEQIKTAREEAAKEARDAALAEVKEQQFTESYRKSVEESTRWLNSESANEIGRMIAWAVQKVEAGEMTGAQVLAQVNARNIEAGPGQKLSSHIQTRDTAILDAAQNEWLSKEYPNWRAPAGLTKQRELAVARGDTLEVYRLRREIDKQAWLENEAPKELKKLAEVERAKTTTAKKVAETQSADSARANAPKPLNGTGTSASGGMMTSVQIEAIPYSEWMNLPQERRDYLLANKHVADQRKR